MSKNILLELIVDNGSDINMKKAESLIPQALKGISQKEKRQYVMSLITQTDLYEEELFVEKNWSDIPMDDYFRFNRPHQSFVVACSHIFTNAILNDIFDNRDFDSFMYFLRAGYDKHVTQAMIASVYAEYSKDTEKHKMIYRRFIEVVNTHIKTVSWDFIVRHDYYNLLLAAVDHPDSKLSDLKENLNRISLQEIGMLKAIAKSGDEGGKFKYNGNVKLDELGELYNLLNK